MKILLVAPESDIFPMGIAYISASLKKEGHKVKCINLSFTKDLTPFFKDKYDFLATGGLSVQYNQIRDIIQQAKKFNVKIIVGGGIITAEPALISRALEVDYAIIGEGEITINKLLFCLENHNDLSKVPGIGYFEGGKFKLTPPRKQIDNINLLPFPDCDGFNLEKKLENTKPSQLFSLDVFDYPREYPIITSRSCPFRCTFCYHPVGNKYRQRPVDSIMEELEEVIPKYRINIVSIFDELFSYDEARVIEFCRRFKAYIDTIPWEVKWGCQMRVDRINEKMLNVMKNSGCYIISYGFESYSPIVLKSMKKHITPQQIHRAIHITLKNNISIQGNFIFGDVAETLKTAFETINFWKNHLEAGIILSFITPLPNSEVYQYCIKKGLIKDRIKFVQNALFGNILNFSSMNKAEFAYLRILIHNLEKLKISSVPIKVTPMSLTIKCPFCSKIIEYKNFEINPISFVKWLYCRNCHYRFYAEPKSHKRLSKIRRIPKIIYIVYSCFELPIMDEIIKKLKQIPILKTFLTSANNLFKYHI